MYCTNTFIPFIYLELYYLFNFSIANYFVSVTVTVSVSELFSNMLGLCQEEVKKQLLVRNKNAHLNCFQERLNYVQTCWGNFLSFFNTKKNLLWKSCWLITFKISTIYSSISWKISAHFFSRETKMQNVFRKELL